MNLIARLDAFLLSRVFQPAVDASQRQPAWWARQSIVLSAVILLLIGVLYGWHWLLAVAGLWVPVVLLFTYAPGALAALGGFKRLRWFMVLYFVALWVAFALILPSVGGSFWLRMLHDVSQLAFFYFAACRPPAPPKRRTAPVRRALHLGAA